MVTHSQELTTLIGAALAEAHYQEDDLLIYLLEMALLAAREKAAEQKLAKQAEHKQSA